MSARCFGYVTEKVRNGTTLKVRIQMCSQLAGTCTLLSTFRFTTRFAFASGRYRALCVWLGGAATQNYHSFRADDFQRKLSLSAQLEVERRTGPTLGAMCCCPANGTVPTCGRVLFLTQTQQRMGMVPCVVVCCGRSLLFILITDRCCRCWGTCDVTAFGPQNRFVRRAPCASCLAVSSRDVPSRFGFYNIVGNVWEWVLDPWSVHRQRKVESADISAAISAAHQARAKDMKRAGGYSVDERVKKGGSFMVSCGLVLLCCDEYFPTSCCGVVSNSVTGPTAIDIERRPAVTTPQTLRLPTQDFGVPTITRTDSLNT